MALDTAAPAYRISSGAQAITLSSEVTLSPIPLVIQSQFGMITNANSAPTLTTGRGVQQSESGCGKNVI